MIKKKYTSRILPLCFSLILLTFSISAVFELKNTIVKNVSVIKDAIVQSHKTVLVLNNIINKIPDKKSEQGSKRKKGTNKYSEYLIYFLSTILIGSEKVFFMLVLTAFVLSAAAVNNFWGYLEKDIFKEPGIQLFRRRWRLKFIAFIQKCILFRSDIFDIDPLLSQVAVFNNTPYFVYFNRMRGFFYE